MSVIVPFFNAGAYLAEAIASILAQDYRPLELLLVDDGSTDGRADAVTPLAATAAQVRLLPLPSNQGPAVARNVGLRAARGELLTFLDADDVMCPGRLSFQARYLATHTDVDVVIGMAETVLERGVTPPRWLEGAAGARRRRYHCAMTMLAPRRVFDRVGAFDASYRIGEDTDWMLRARVAGLAVATVDRVLIRRRVHGANLTYRTEEMRAAIHRTVLRLVRERIAARSHGA